MAVNAHTGFAGNSQIITKTQKTQRLLQVLKAQAQVTIQPWEHPTVQALISALGSHKPQSAAT
jgi:hypothetical protein